jgi:UPF0271 protein
VRSIDLNSDLGEGAGYDAEIMRFVTSANIACGGHAGDERTMRETIALALEHYGRDRRAPGYPDRANWPDADAHGAARAHREVAAQVRALAEIAARSARACGT